MARNHRETVPAKRLANQLGKGAPRREGMEAAANRLQNAIKVNTPVDTGELQQSVRVRAVVQTKNPRFEVETAPHGLFVERGTKHVRARPFIRQTAKSTRRDWEATGRAAARGDDE